MSFKNSILLIGLCSVLIGCGPEEHKEVVTITDYGTVSSVSDCYVQKYSMTCSVKTNLFYFSSLRIDYFPDKHISIGDNIFMQEKSNGRKVKGFMCKNNLCVSSSVCYWWMPCFKGDDK